jgi:hypothetical protein
MPARFLFARCLHREERHRVHSEDDSRSPTDCRTISAWRPPPSTSLRMVAPCSFIVALRRVMRLPTSLSIAVSAECARPHLRSLRRDAGHARMGDPLDVLGTRERRSGDGRRRGLRDQAEIGLHLRDFAFS